MQFFLELWTEINHKAALRARAEATASLPDPKSSSEDDVPEGTIFEELVTQYGKLVDRAEDMIVHTVCHEVEFGLRQHFSSGGSAYVRHHFSNRGTPLTYLCSQGTPSSSAHATDDISLPATLLAPIALLSSQLTFLQSALPQTTVTSLYRRIASHLATHILQRAIMYRGRARITPLEGKMILTEAELWVQTCRYALSRAPARAEAPWRSLLQAARVVGAQDGQWERIVDATFGTASDADWEQEMREVVGLAELSREEVSQIIRTRTDCER